MRRFRDNTGRAWDVVVGRESWGTLVALFVPSSPGTPMRQAVLQSVSQLAAEAELEAMADAALLELWRKALPKE